MKPRHKIIWGVMVFLLTVGLLYAGKTQGHYTSRMIEKLPVFHALTVQGNIEVDFMQKPTAAVHASGPQKLLEAASVRVKDGRLEIAFLPDSKVSKRDALHVFVTGPALREVKITGEGDVRVRGQLKEQDLSIVLEQRAEFSADDVAVHTLAVQAWGHSEIDINRLDAHQVKAVANGQAEIELAGLALTAELENNDSGKIDTADLRVQQGKVVAKGKGEVKVSAYEKLDASALGKGKIKYKGHPIQLNRNGTLKYIVPDTDD